MVLDTFAKLSTGHENGTTLDAVIAELAGSLSKAQVKSAAEALVSDGSLYNSCDEEHFLPCFAG